MNNREYTDNYEDAYVSVYFRIDNKYQIYERKIYSVLDLLGDVGGMLEAIRVLGFLIVGFISSKQFQAALLSKVYQQEKPPKENNDP